MLLSDHSGYGRHTTDRDSLTAAVSEWFGQGDNFKAHGRVDVMPPPDWYDSLDSALRMSPGKAWWVPPINTPSIHWYFLAKDDADVAWTFPMCRWCRDLLGSTYPPPIIKFDDEAVDW